MTELIKRNNYVDGSFIDVDDFKTEQNYFLEKIRATVDQAIGDGLLSIRGLEVIPDSIMSEPIALEKVLIPIEQSPDITAANPQNYTLFPDALSTFATSFNIYTTFKATTGNIQKVSLRLTLAQDLSGEALDLIIRIKQLADPSNPQSPLSNLPPLFEGRLTENEIPLVDTDELLVVDLSKESSGQGLTIKSGNYYAIQLEFRRISGSTKNIRLFHGPINENSNLDSKMFSWIFSEGSYKQNYLDSLGLQQQLLFYYCFETSAVKITPGEAIIKGKRTIVEADQFISLEIPDRRNVDDFGNVVYNYVILRYLELYTDPELVKETRNTVNTRIKDYSKIEILTQPQWDQLIGSERADKDFLLLALVNDSNIESIYKKHTFSIPSNSTKLAFHDWLNPTNVSPSSEAELLRSSRPSDFIFYVCNIPSKVPFADSFGTIKLEPITVKDEFGNVLKSAGDPILDEITRVVVNVTLANGSDTRSFELSMLSEQGTGSIKYRNYAATITSIFDNPFDELFSFNFNSDQVAPNVIYNFIAYTKRGLPIYIQDYNKVITKDETTTALREMQFTLFAERGARTLVIPEDLKLGAFKPATDGSQPGVINYVPSLILNEPLIPVGTAQQIQVLDGYQAELTESKSFLFEAPMMNSLDSLLLNKDEDLTSAYDNGDVTILVDTGDGFGPIDITFSGPEDRDLGGNGSRVLVRGSVAATVSLSTSSSYEVKARRLNGKDCTNYDSSYTPYGAPLVGGSTDIRDFNLLIRGKNISVSPINLAGFEDGDFVYIWIGDRQAYDQNFQPIGFTFDSAETDILLPTIFHLGSQKYFREKIISSTENSAVAAPGMVLIDTGSDKDGSTRSLGQVIFNFAEIPSSIISTAKIYLRYNAARSIPQNIDYYQTRYPLHGTKDGFKIENSSIVASADNFISVPEALALSSNISSNLSITDTNFSTIALFVDGINITSNLSPIGQKEIVADTPNLILESGKVAYNPTTGTFKFYKSLGLDGYVSSEAPSDFTRLTVSYYKLDTRYVFNSTTDLVYRPKFDLNNDGRIDELDLQIFNRAFGSSIGSLRYLAAADFNQDGKVDQNDLALFEESFGAVALGVPDYSDATSARLNSLLVMKKGNYLETFRTVRAVSKSADSLNPNGLTILFLDNNTPIKETGEYEVRFGFRSALYQGFNQIEVETARPLYGLFNLSNIQMYEAENPTNKKSMIAVESSLVANANGFYPTLLTFTSSIDTTSTFIVKSVWNKDGLAIKSALDLVVPRNYDHDRKFYGPFKLDYSNQDFKLDGSSISCRLKISNASLADGSPDPTGRFILGIPLSEFTFTIHLTLKEANNTQSIWTWHQVRPSGIDNRIVLEFNDKLFIDHRNRGKGGANVLTPFGLGTNQVRLLPKFAGGDLENNLSNISIIRSDVVSEYVTPHSHLNERDGGILNSRSVKFVDDYARLNLETTSDLTDTVYKLLDLIKDQEREIQLLKAIEGATRYDRGLRWDSPDVFWDS